MTILLSKRFGWQDFCRADGLDVTQIHWEVLTMWRLVAVRAITDSLARGSPLHQWFIVIDEEHLP